MTIVAGRGEAVCQTTTPCEFMRHVRNVVQFDHVMPPSSGEGRTMNLKGLFSRKPIPSEDVDLLFRYLLEPNAAFIENIEKFIDLGGPNRDAFLTKDMIYQLALAMLSILSREKKDSRFSTIRKRFADMVISPIRAEDVEFQSAYMVAMREIADLESPESTHLKWAMEWFDSIGIEVRNPVDAGLFVIMWKQRLAGNLKLLADIGNQY